MQDKLNAKRFEQLVRYSDRKHQGKKTGKIARYQRDRDAIAAKNTEAEAWKALALKPIGSTIKVEKRQFFGNSTLLNEKIQNKIVNHINDILQP